MSGPAGEDEDATRRRAGGDDGRELPFAAAADSDANGTTARRLLISLAWSYASPYDADNYVQFRC